MEEWRLFCISEVPLEGFELAMFSFDWVVGIYFKIILQNIYIYMVLYFCISYHIPQVKRKHAGHAWNDTHILRRERNEIREVCTDTFVMVILCFMSWEVNI